MKLIFALTLVLLANHSFSQDYNDMPLAVQQKMDLNKQNNLPIFTDVYSNYEITLYGLNQTSINPLKNSLQNDTRIVSFEVTNNYSKLIVKAKGAFTIKDMKLITAPSGASIENYTTNYFVY